MKIDVILKKAANRAAKMALKKSGNKPDYQESLNMVNKFGDYLMEAIERGAGK